MAPQEEIVRSMALLKVELQLAFKPTEALEELVVLVRLAVQEMGAQEEQLTAALQIQLALMATTEAVAMVVLARSWSMTMATWPASAGRGAWVKTVWRWTAGPVMMRPS